MKYYVYSGTINCDNNSCLTHTLQEFETEHQVLVFYKEFIDGIREDDQEVFFRVIQGDELILVPFEKVVEYKLGSKHLHQPQT